MTSVDITEFFNAEDFSNYSASAAELGDDAGTITWNAALAYAKAHPAMLGEQGMADWRQEVASMGAWTEEEREDWTDEDFTALFVQFTAGHLRESDLGPGCDWPEYYDRAAQGHIPSCFYEDAGKVFVTAGC